MSKHDFVTRKSMKKEPERADFECYKDCGSMKSEAIRRYQSKSSRVKRSWETCVHVEA